MSENHEKEKVIKLIIRELHKIENIDELWDIQEGLENPTDPSKGMENLVAYWKEKGINNRFTGGIK